MVFRNQVKNEIVTRVAPCGFSKSRHKKMVKKKIAKDISLEDLNNIGYGFGRLVKTFRDGIARGLEEDEVWKVRCDENRGNSTKLPNKVVKDYTQRN